MKTFRIISVPQGEQELWVRAAHIGPSFPMCEDAAIRQEIFSFIRTRLLKQEYADGYVVLVKDAITALREFGQHPAAAYWEEWQKKNSRSWLVFLKRECAELPDSLNAH